MQLYYIRHAQSANNALYDLTGSAERRSMDPGITETGWEQSKILAGFLARSNPDRTLNGRDAQNQRGFGLTHLYCSLMRRSIETGAVVSKVLGLSLIAWTEIHEGGGIYLDDENGMPVGHPGPNRAELATRFPGLVLPDWLGEQGWWNRAYEKREERPLRARRVLDELLRRHSGTEDRVGMIGHGGFFKHFMTQIYNLPIDGYWFMMNNVAITRLDFTDEVALVYQNRLDFLPDHLIT
ncbi:MAG: histidine phosphatase family protein [Anaerolineales bacterium]|nr:histidine phosphatase family protein [Anaerolineales bacterium]